MDIFDRAQEAEEKFRRQALAVQLRRGAGGRVTSSQESCVRCGAAIPLARREAVPGCDLCIGCQGRLEEGGV